MARPRKEIDWEDFDKLCAIHCTKAEIASWFDCHEDTIENAVRRDKKESFSAYWDKRAGKGKVSIRRAQYQAAMDGNITMMIWLGKNLLGQADERDKPEPAASEYLEADAPLAAAALPPGAMPSTAIDRPVQDSAGGTEKRQDGDSKTQACAEPLGRENPPPAVS